MNCRAKLRQRRLRRAGFTLFELILALALAAILLGLIGTAINLYLVRIDASRAQVEEAQLARSILAMIANDIREATIYQPQDTSAIAQLMSSAATFDVDSIDEENGGDSGGEGGGGGGDGGGGGSGDGGSGSGGSGTGSGGGSGGGGSSPGGGAGAPATTSASAESEFVMPLGLNGSLSELYVDVSRLPRSDELFGVMTGYTNAPGGLAAAPAAMTASMIPVVPGRPSDVKTIRYFIRQGESIDPSSVAATGLDPNSQLRAGGLVRQEVDRTTRIFAEEMGNQAVLDSGQTLIAPEVIHIEFRFFDGTSSLEYWDMKENGALPPAVEIRLWLVSADDPDNPGVLPQYSVVTGMPPNAHEYLQTVFLPMSQSSSAAAGTSSTGAGAAGAGSEDSSTSL